MLLVHLVLLPFIFSGVINEQLSLDTANHRLDPDVFPSDYKEVALKKFKLSLNGKKKLLYNDAEDSRNFVVQKRKIVKQPLTVEAKEDQSPLDDNLIVSTNSTGVAPFSWLREKLSFMMNSSSKSMKSIADSFSSTLWHMTMPAHMAV